MDILQAEIVFRSKKLAFSKKIFYRQKMGFEENC